MVIRGFRAYVSGEAHEALCQAREPRDDMTGAKCQTAGAEHVVSGLLQEIERDDYTNR